MMAYTCNLCILRAESGGFLQDLVQPIAVIIRLGRNVRLCCMQANSTRELEPAAFSRLFLRFEQLDCIHLFIKSFQRYLIIFFLHLRVGLIDTTR